MTELPSPPGQFLVRVRPAARKDAIVSFEDGVLFVDVAAPAHEGKANLRLVKFLSRELGHQVRIKSGASAKTKTLVFL